MSVAEAFVEAIEQNNAPASTRSMFEIFFILIFVIPLSLQVALFLGVNLIAHPPVLADFNDFYLVGQSVWRGKLAQAYHFASIFTMEKADVDRSVAVFMPWSYPPVFDLCVALLALIPVGVSYTIFICSTLAFYLIVLKKIAKDSFYSVLVSIFPAIFIAIWSGQNGFLTGTLIGLSCLGMQHHRSWAGVPLGMMVIKPHLAITLGIYAVVSRHWKAVFVAAITATLLCLLATIVLGWPIWLSFIDSLASARAGLALGVYPFYRMVSVYVTLFTFGVPATVSALFQLVAALGAIAMVWFASRRFSPNVAMGLAIISMTVISPYIYDYDLPVFGIGLALLIPDIKRLGTAIERLALYLLCLIAAGWGVGSVFGHAIVGQIQSGLQPALHPASEIVESIPLSLGGVAAVSALVLCWFILSRETARAPEVAI